MEHPETERKYAIADSAPSPEVGPPFSMGAAGRFELVADYVDTPDLTLVRSGRSLRRRTGGSDEGWHLKLPKVLDSRVELWAPLTEGPSPALVPRTLRAELHEVVDLDALVPVARVVTDRAERSILLDGAVVAQLADDHVSATTAAGRFDSWREVEVELVDGDASDADAIERQLLGQGLTPASGGSKIARALDLPSGAAQNPDPPSAGDVVMAHVRRQVGAIQGLEDRARRDQSDAVHKMRVATRRLRSSLRSFRRLFDRSVTEPLGAELRWLAEQLGRARDAEVLRAQVLAALDELPPQSVVGGVRERLSGQLEAEHLEAHGELVRALDSERYRRLLAELVELLVRPPLRGRASRPAHKTLGRLVDKVERRVERARQAVAEESDPRRQEDLLHVVRKRAKAARYAHEALGPSFGKEAQRASKQWEKVTESLGTFQDMVVITERLVELEKAAAEAGEPTTTLTELIAAERSRGQAALKEARASLEDVIGA
ncbi:MAG TPA: CYTH and CHAD domain-containing protein [Intrasporangium sp.]|uniref:CYTH and CHAD domain-containing protein n=1 Tax=Intrasporangium sp. TaxID=1925024 RepID=UPI002D79E781|nr:CYTH and CHAD domain-containing protein [Intrasporangium sp.]HET7397200.1 CYTH and CHAD domain-containing protein [Intrasporangium sp.]